MKHTPHRFYDYDVAYDTKGYPHRKLRYMFIISKGQLKKTQGVSRLPKGWSWRRK